MSDTDKLTAQEAAEVVERINARRRFAGPGPGSVESHPRLRAWERAIPPPVTVQELRDSYRTLKEAYRRRDPELAEWRAAFHAKLEAFLNQ